MNADFSLSAKILTICVICMPKLLTNKPLNYLLEIEFYYNAISKVLEAERDYELAAAELWAVEL